MVEAGRRSAPRRSLAFFAIDGPNEQLFAEMLAGGELPNLRRMADEGLSGAITHTKQFRNERCWSLFLAGSDTPETGADFDSRSYTYRNVFPGERGPPPFYAGAGSGHTDLCVRSRRAARPQAERHANPPLGERAQ